MRNLNPSPSNGAEDEEMTVELDLTFTVSVEKSM